MDKELDYVTLKEAARTLSVHEQTIRNWERRGVIQLVRLPGSRYRRVPTTEIARLKAQMTQAEPQIHAGVRVCQLVLMRTEGRAQYRGRFWDQEDL